jgi:hypothetical protein
VAKENDKYQQYLVWYHKNKMQIDGSCSGHIFKNLSNCNIMVVLGNNTSTSIINSFLKLMNFDCKDQ